MTNDRPTYISATDPNGRTWIVPNDDRYFQQKPDGTRLLTLKGAIWLLNAPEPIETPPED